MEKSNIGEKIKLLTGSGMWHTREAEGLPSVHLSDGPHGLRKQEERERQNNVSLVSTCYPTASALACSWDVTAAERLGRAVAKEAWNADVAVLLGPGINMKRSPLCGRNFEYFSEDPFLAGQLGAAYVSAAQGENVAVSLKHFAANNQETNRQTSNSQIDERALREIYLSAFEYVVKTARPATVMASYNRLNGYYACENRHLLTEILREEWGFDGVVISDWGACADLAKAVKAGMDLEMPDSHGIHARKLKAALKAGEISEADIAQAAGRIEKLVKKYAPDNRVKKDTSDAHEIAKQLACESAVLLKNDGILPIHQHADVVVIGALAEQMRFQGGGSSHINTASFPNALDALRKLGVTVAYAPGYSLKDEENRELEEQALALAAGQKTVLFFGGLTDQYEGEGYDRESLAMPANQLRLLDKICEINPNVAVVSFSGAPYDMAFEKKVRGILQMYLGGEAVGEACGELLTGWVNPSGKLAESWPYAVEDTPCHGFFATGSDDIVYRESIFMGYRYYDSFGIPVRFPFGFGLSYTIFAYGNPELSSETYEGGKLQVSLDVTNTGSAAGAEIVELYVENPSVDYLRAKKELKGFQKVFLQSGESRTVTFPLTDRSFAVWQDGWKIPAGKYTVCIGGLTSEVEKSGETLPVPALQKGSFYESCTGKPNQADWEAMLGRTYAPPVLKKGSFTMDNTVLEMKDYSLIMKIMFKAVEATIAKGFGGKKDYENPEFRMLMNSSAGSPLRSMQISGGMKGGVLPGMLEMANGHFFRGLWRMIRG